MCSGHSFLIDPFTPSRFATRRFIFVNDRHVMWQNRCGRAWHTSAYLFAFAAMTRLAVIAFDFVAFEIFDAIQGRTYWSAYGLWNATTIRVICINLPVWTWFQMTSFHACIFGTQFRIFGQRKHIVASFDSTSGNTGLVFRTVAIALHCWLENE